MEKKQFIHVIKTALQAAKELGGKIDPDKFKAFVAESNSMAGTVRPFDREVEQQLADLNDYAKRFGKLKPAKTSRSSGNNQFF